ncbi:MAG: rubrerythrin family protein [Deltaproteobacteria bacterium]|nr:rubrerythrin family protein [Deltaproteobacteria bacterium]
MSKTSENLANAFAGESQACMRYLAFAEKADQEGYPGVARLFRAASKAELFHALSHLRAAGGVEGTLENLKSALDGENYEFKQMYPGMIKDAVAENQLEARHSLEYAMSIEMIHAKMFKKALEDPHAMEEAVYFVCPICGNTVSGKPPNKCPYCGVDAKDFVEVV